MSRNRPPVLLPGGAAISRRCFVQGLAAAGTLAALPFPLRPVLAATNPPRFYRAAVGMAFRGGAMADKLLRQVTQSARGSWEATEAECLRSAIRGNRVLHKAAVHPQPSRIRYSIKRGNLHIPLTINGRNAEYVFDTCAGTSVVNESEARRLGLKLFKVDGTADDVMGAKIRYRHVGLGLSPPIVRLRSGFGRQVIGG